MKTIALFGWLALIAFSATANAETITFEADTITAGSSCLAGDPLCDDSFACYVEDGVRVCESVSNWARASKCQTVGVEGWVCQ
jgi:hypothetical protein